MVRPVAQLTDHLGYRLRQVSNHVSQAFARKLEARNVTVAEWVLMRVLFDREPMPPSEVAEATGLTRGAITKLADRLIAKGMIVRKASTDDGRMQSLALTSRGQALVPQLAALADRNEAEAFSHLGESERKALERILGKIIAKLAIDTTPVD